MTLKECRQHAAAWPERYKIEAKVLKGNDVDTPLFMYRLLERKDESLVYSEVFNSAPLGIGKANSSGIGCWMFWDMETLKCTNTY